MIDVFKAFYSIHYNFAAVSVLLLALIIFLLTKKNYKWTIIFTALLVVFNVFIYKKTAGKSWTIELEPEEKTSNSFYKPEAVKMTFSTTKDWTIKDDKGVVHHWCWVDTYWDKFASMDLVAWIWGENSSKKMMKATENHAEEAINQDR